MSKKILRLLLSIFLILGGSMLSGLFMKRPDLWYQALDKPLGTPPGYVFGPVWTVLYIMMAVSFWGFWNFSKPSKQKTLAYSFFFLQLLLNFTWTFTFFTMQNLFLGFVHIVVMILAVLSTIVLFWKGCKWSSILLWPYFLWICFAGYLNYFLWVLNR